MIFFCLRTYHILQDCNAYLFVVYFKNAVSVAGYVLTNDVLERM
jgi:hypothetical protein